MGKPPVFCDARVSVPDEEAGEMEVVELAEDERVDQAAGGVAPRYYAFISYSHADEAMARRIHRWLETYRIPAHAVGRATPRGAVPRRLSPIFRDRNELSASADLNEEVETALAESGCLVVLCSPAAKASRWVNSEIALFRALHPDRPVLAALLDGEPADAFPAALLRPRPDGTTPEPIAADFRKHSDGPKLARLKLASGLAGLPLDELVQREAQRQLQRVMAITLAAIVSTLILGLLLIFALNARNEAERQRQQAEGLIEFMLTDLRTRLQGVGRLDILGAVNERALGYYGEQGDLSALPSGSLERRARVLHAMGQDDHTRGAPDAALTKFREAHRVTTALLADDPDDPQRIFAHAQSEFWIGYVDYNRRRYPAALPHFQAYRQLATRLVEMEPANPKYQRELGYAEGNICTIAVTAPGTDGSESGLQACKGALAAMQSAANALPADQEIQSDLANRHAWMADALNAAGRRREALSERQRQLAIVNRLVAIDPKNATYRQDWVLARYSTAELLVELGETPRARAMAREAMKMLDTLIATDPENHDWRAWRRKVSGTFTDSTTED